MNVFENVFFQFFRDFRFDFRLQICFVLFCYRHQLISGLTMSQDAILHLSDGRTSTYECLWISFRESRGAEFE